jgi:uncharacterized protein
MDGFGAAYSVWMKDPTYEFVAIQYGDDLPDLEGYSEVLMVDFSLKRDQIEELMKKTKVVIIDHHVSAEKELSPLRESPLLKIHNSEIMFNMDQSGAVMAWNYFHGELTERGIEYTMYGREYPPLLLRYIQDRDLWTKELPESEEVTCFLQSEIDFLNTSFSDFNQLVRKFEYNSSVFMIAGRNVLKFKNKMIDTICANHRVDKFQACGKKWMVPYVNSSLFQSEIGNVLSRDYPFAVVYYTDEKSGKTIFSLRSNPNGEDVSVIAKSLGGGGHKHAAGFSKPSSRMR